MSRGRSTGTNDDRRSPAPSPDVRVDTQAATGPGCKPGVSDFGGSSPPPPTMRTTEEYMRKVAELRARFAPPAGWRFSSYEALVLEMGQHFEPPYLLDPKRGPLRQCWSNAENAALRAEGWEYVEGWACSHDLPYFPVEHGWCLNEQGQVVEVTWEKPGVDYFGVVIPFNVIVASGLQTGTHGVLGSDWKREFKLLREGW